MSRNYDSWERLVAAVLKRDQIWKLCHQPSRSPSICSEASSSDFSSSGHFQANEGSAQRPVPKLFPLESVLKRSRELGKGRFGTSILTQLQQGVQLSDHEFLAEGTQLVMKKHENVAVPRAYYFSKNGNYIFNDYHTQGSLYHMLHGKGNERPNWESRLKIAIGAARGIAHIHTQYGGKLALGNIKSSNICLNSLDFGCVSDFGLAGIITRPGKWAALRHRALEYNLKNASDVYSFGVVLLELLTSKSVVEPGVWRNVDIVEWALSMRPEDWRSKLFDQSLFATN